MSPDNEATAPTSETPTAAATARREVRIPNRILTTAEQSAVVNSAVAEMRAQGDSTPEDQLRRNVRRALRRHQKGLQRGKLVISGPQERRIREVAKDAADELDRLAADAA